MKVWTVEFNDWDTHDLIGIFATEKEANEVMEEHKKWFLLYYRKLMGNEKYEPGHWDVYEYTLGEHERSNYQKSYESLVERNYKPR